MAAAAAVRTEAPPVGAPPVPSGTMGGRRVATGGAGASPGPRIVTFADLRAKEAAGGAGSPLHVRFVPPTEAERAKEKEAIVDLVEDLANQMLAFGCFTEETQDTIIAIYEAVWEAVSSGQADEQIADTIAGLFHYVLDPAMEEEEEMDVEVDDDYLNTLVYFEEKCKKILQRLLPGTSIGIFLATHRQYMADFERDEEDSEALAAEVDKILASTETEVHAHRKAAMDRAEAALGVAYDEASTVADRISARVVRAAAAAGVVSSGLAAVEARDTAIDARLVAVREKNKEQEKRSKEQFAKIRC